MKKGDIVTIFTDPINLKIPEGQAILVEKKRDLQSVELWVVNFLDDDNRFNYTRLIKKL